MARSTYIYVVSYTARVGVSAPILARTVKYELVKAMSHFPAAMLADVEVWRCRDEGASYDGPEGRTFLGTGPEFLAKETPPSPPKVPCLEGFHWIGQSFATCDMCTLPAWEHEGMAKPKRGETPFDKTSWVLEPWGPGEREACRAKWEVKTP